MSGRIDLDQALANADSANNLRLKIKLAGLHTDEAGDLSVAQGKAEQGGQAKAPNRPTLGAFRLQD